MVKNNDNSSINATPNIEEVAKTTNDTKQTTKIDSNIYSKYAKQYKEILGADLKNLQSELETNTGKLKNNKTKDEKEILKARNKEISKEINEINKEIKETDKAIKNYNKNYSKDLETLEKKKETFKKSYGIGEEDVADLDEALEEYKLPTIKDLTYHNPINIYSDLEDDNANKRSSLIKGATGIESKRVTTAGDNYITAKAKVRVHELKFNEMQTIVEKKVGSSGVSQNDLKAQKIKEGLVKKAEKLKGTSGNKATKEQIEKLDRAATLIDIAEIAGIKVKVQDLKNVTEEIGIEYDINANKYIESSRRLDKYEEPVLNKEQQDFLNKTNNELKANAQLDRDVLLKEGITAPDLDKLDQAIVTGEWVDEYNRISENSGVDNPALPLVKYIKNKSYSTTLEKKYDKYINKETTQEAQVTQDVSAQQTIQEEPIVTNSETITTSPNIEEVAKPEIQPQSTKIAIPNEGLSAAIDELKKATEEGLEKTHPQEFKKRVEKVDQEFEKNDVKPSDQVFLDDTKEYSQKRDMGGGVTIVENFKPESERKENFLDRYNNKGETFINYKADPPGGAKGKTYELKIQRVDDKGSLVPGAIDVVKVTFDDKGEPTYTPESSTGVEGTYSRLGKDFDAKIKELGQEKSQSKESSIENSGSSITVSNESPSVEPISKIVAVENKLDMPLPQMKVNQTSFAQQLQEAKGKQLKPPPLQGPQQGVSSKAEKTVETAEFKKIINAVKPEQATGLLKPTEVKTEVKKLVDSMKKGFNQNTDANAFTMNNAPKDDQLQRT